MNEDQVQRLIREVRRPSLTDKLAAGAMAWWLGGLLAFPLLCVAGWLMLEGDRAWPGGVHAWHQAVRWVNSLGPVGLLLALPVGLLAGRLLGALWVAGDRHRPRYRGARRR